MASFPSKRKKSKEEKMCVSGSETQVDGAAVRPTDAEDVVLNDINEIWLQPQLQPDVLV